MPRHGGRRCRKRGVAFRYSLLGDLELFDCLFEGGLGRLGDGLGGLGAGCLHVLGLLDHHLVALAHESGLELEDLGERLHANQRFHVGEVCFGAGAQSVVYYAY